MLPLSVWKGRTKQDGLANPLLAARWEPEIQLADSLAPGVKKFAVSRASPAWLPPLTASPMTQVRWWEVAAGAFPF